MAMDPPVVFLLLLLLASNGLVPLAQANVRGPGTTGTSEKWGYVDVRAGAHMFWWLHYTQSNQTSEVPLLLWLQGGPGASGVGFGSFQEFGPVDLKLKPNPYTWLKKAHLLFVENPVGTGFSYVDDPSLLTTNIEEVANDMMVFLHRFYKDHPELKRSPLYVFCESYGGKFATQLGLALHNATRAGRLQVQFAGVALGNTWISSVDSVLSWAPQLRAFTRVDQVGAEAIRSATQDVVKLVESQRWLEARQAWDRLEYIVEQVSNGVDFYNILAPDHAAPVQSDGAATASSKRSQGPSQRSTSRRLQEDGAESEIEVLMNGPIKQKLGIIPANLTWKEVSLDVFNAHSADFMKDTISQVATLLDFGVNVTIFSGQLDLICATVGTEAWVQKLNWTHLSSFNSAERTPLYFGQPSTGGFVRKYRNLAFYWILNAGHMVPADQPHVALEMVGMITGT